MKRLAAVFSAFLLCGMTAAQQHAHHTQPKPVTLMPGLGDLHHPVTTGNSEAQKFFDQGLRLIFAFNHDEATSSFRHPAELNPKLPMPHCRIPKSVRPTSPYPPPPR